MLNTLWLGFFLTAAVAALAQWLVGGNAEIFSSMVQALFQMAKLSVEVMLLLFGTLTLWLGFLRIAEKAGIVDALARWLAPLFAKAHARGAARPPLAGADHDELCRQRPGAGQRGHPHGSEGDESLAGAEPRARHRHQRADPVPGAQRLFAHAAAGDDLHVPHAAGSARPDAGFFAHSAGHISVHAGGPAQRGCGAAPAAVGAPWCWPICCPSRWF